MKIVKAILLMITATGCLSYASENLRSVERQDAAIRRIKELQSKKTPAARLEIAKLQALIKKLETDRATDNRYQADLAQSHKEHFDTHYPHFQELDLEIEKLQRKYVRKFDEQRTSNLENREKSAGMIGVWENFPGLSRRSSAYMTRYHKARIAALEKEASKIGTDPALQKLDQQIEALKKEQDDLGI